MNSSWLWVVLALLLLFLAARYARPAKDLTGNPVTGVDLPTRDQQQFSVATFNIQTGKSLQGQRDISKSAAVLADADLVGVQEVYAAGWLNKLGLGSSSQIEALEAGSGSQGVFAATRRRWFREHRGNAILSKLAIPAWRSVMLPDRSGKSYRNMMIAEVEWQGSSFHFINTHLHTGDGRDQQIDLVFDEAAKYPRVILLGDFNSKQTNAKISSAIAGGKFEDAISLAGLDLQNTDRIDWIFTKGFRIHTGQMIDKGISDHPLYQVSLSYK